MVHLEPQELKEFQVRAGVWDLKENLEKKETQDYGVLVGALNHQVQFIHTGDGSLVVVMSPLFTKVCIIRILYYGFYPQPTHGHIQMLEFIVNHVCDVIFQKNNSNRCGMAELNSGTWRKFLIIVTDSNSLG